MGNSISEQLIIIAKDRMDQKQKDAHNDLVHNQAVLAEFTNWKKNDAKLFGKLQDMVFQHICFLTKNQSIEDIKRQVTQSPNKIIIAEETATQLYISLDGFLGLPIPVFNTSEPHLSAILYGSSAPQHLVLQAISIWEQQGQSKIEMQDMTNKGKGPA